MAKRLTVEQQIAELVTLLEQPVTDDTLTALRTALASKQNLVVAKAAELAATHKLTVLQPELEAAFARLMLDPVKSDKACVGKTTVVQTLQKLALPAEGTYLVGVRHVQLEPVWGGDSDTAKELRGLCGFGLVQMGYAGVMPILVDLLADPAPETRIAAVQALAATGQDASLLLLRFKVHTGDADPNVVAECLGGMMRLSPRNAVEFVSGFLANPDSALAEPAAVALGESRTLEALNVLTTHYRERLTRASRRIVLHAIALIRLPEAIEMLVEIVRADDVPSAVHALEALAMYKRDEHVRMRLQAIVNARGEPALIDTLKEWTAEVA